MGAVQEIFRRHAAAYRAQFGETMPASHQRVIDAIIDRRSAACGSILYQCEDCGEPHVAARCCGNATVRGASRATPNSGSPASSNDSCRPLTSCSPLPCPHRCANFCAATRAPAMERCSMLPPQRSRPWPPMAGTWAPTPRASSGCCTPNGAGNSSTTRTSTTWCPAVASIVSTGAGMLQLAASFCRCTRSRRSSAPSSAMP